MLSNWRDHWQQAVEPLHSGDRMSLISSCFAFVLVMLVQIKMSVYRKKWNLWVTPLDKECKKEFNFCCPPGAFKNILSQTQVEITTPACPGLPSIDAPGSSNPSAEQIVSVQLNLPQQKRDGFTKTYWFEEFSALHPRPSKKAKGYSHHGQ